jgi:hypothetical protein
MLENNTINDGISRADAEKILINFLNDESLKVLAIKGRWGVGKTHLVQNVLEKSSGKQFYYSSMFGVSSLEQLKGQILVNVNKPTINESNPQKNWHQLIFNPIKKLFQLICETIKKPFQSVLSWISQNSSQVSKIPKIEDLSLLGSIKVPLSGAVISIGGDLLLNYLFSMTKNSIICIDDLERKSSSFQLDELLGFVDYLVQKLHSKVILIYNEDRLFNDKLSKENLNDYREKIIDIEIFLNPKTEENILLVFKNEHDLEIIQETLKATNTSNIRIFRKILRVVNHLHPIMESWHPNLRRQIIINTIILTLGKFDIESPIKIEKILECNKFFSGLNKQELLSDELRNIFFILNTYNYQHIETDGQIIKIIETALFEEEEFVRYGDLLSKREEQKHTLEEFRKIWQPYYNSFRQNETEIKQNLTQFLETNHLNLPIGELEKVENLALCVGVDISPYEKSLLKYVIENEEDIILLKNLKTRVSHFSDLISLLEQKISNWDLQQSITTVLGRLTNRNGWSEIEAEYLNSCTVDDYYDWLQEENNELPALARFCLDMRLPASQNLRNAIIKLAKESKLNAMRANHLYSIDIDDIKNKIE